MRDNDEKPSPPVKPHNKTVRPGGEYLKVDEVVLLMKAAAKEGRYGHRDSTMILIAFRHGLRVKELVSMLDWHQVDLVGKTVKILRCKGGEDSEHTLEKDEVAALKKLDGPRKGPVFTNERGGPMSESSFHKIVARAGKKAGLGDHVHPHMLRHGCGFDMARRELPIRQIQDWLGHKNIQHTVLYTKLGPDRFRKVKMWG